MKTVQGYITQAEKDALKTTGIPRRDPKTHIYRIHWMLIRKGWRVCLVQVDNWELDEH